MSESDLRAASWWVQHKLALRRSGYGALFIFGVAVWGFVTWSYLDAYVISAPREARIPKYIAQQVVPAAALKALTPEPLQPSDATSFNTTDNRIDLSATLTNTNDRWSASVQVRFKVGEQNTPTQTLTILPHSTRTILELGWRDSTGSPQLDVQSIAWTRLPTSLIGTSYDAYAAPRTDLLISDPTFTVSPQNVGSSDFTITNKTGYGFWSIPLTITLLRQGIPLAVNQVLVKELKPGETRTISQQWFEALSGVDKVEVVPYVDVLNPDAYLPTTRFDNLTVPTTPSATPSNAPATDAQLTN